jgi:hypothetical protein
MKTTVLICSVIISLLVCCNGKSNDGVDEMRMSKVAYAPSDKSYYPEAVDTAAAAVDAPETDLKLPEKEIEAKIIKSGNLRYQTDDLEKTYSQIQEAVKKHKAIIKNDSQYNDEDGISRRINIRIPNENFDGFIADISKGVSYFDLKSISSDDVTEEYIDVASRIKTKKVLEERYYGLLKKATKISEMLEIEKKLSEIREEIEAKEGRLRYLQNKVSMSTLDINFYKPVAQGQKATVSYGGRIGNAFVSGFNGISNFFIQLLGIWPVIVTLVVLFILIRKRLKRKNKKDVIENQES